MKKSSEHHVLSPTVQKENDKQSIRNIIENYDSEDAVLMLYTAIIDIRTHRDDHIDECVNKIDSEVKESRKHSTND